MPAPLVGEGTGRNDSGFGLLTKTIVASPVIRWILPVRLRHRSLNDIVFVGENFIEVKQVKKAGHVDHIISKRDFGSKICSAKVFTIDDPASKSEDDLFLSRHDVDYDTMKPPIVPAQLLVLTLSAPAIMFLYITKRPDGSPMFRYQVIETPRAATALEQTGEHLCIDPHSRAMAVASRGGKIILYSVKSREAFKNQLMNEDEDWCPVTQEQIIEDESPISQMAFLHPKSQQADQSDLDHVYLLFIVSDPRTQKTRLKWIDWRVSSGVKKLEKHEQIPLPAPHCVPTLLIPLLNTNFILVFGRRLSFYRHLLTGSPECITTDNIGEGYPPSQPGASPKRPLWINWCRPMRTPNAIQEPLYLCREDGKVFLVDVSRDGSMRSSFAGSLECHVGEAFASLGDDLNPDLLAVAADMSTGRIASIGNWSSSRTIDRSRQETMHMKLVELIPNWASVTDLVVAKVQSSHSRAGDPRDSIFLSSGRQPYGNITEIRKGLEARMLYFLCGIEDLGSMLDIWALPDPTGAVILLMTTPKSTAILTIRGTKGGLCPEFTAGPFNSDERTLIAGVAHGNQLIQITERRIIVAGSLNAAFEDKQEVVLDHGTHVECAVIERDTIVTHEKSTGTNSLCVRKCLTAQTSDDLLSSSFNMALDHDVVCMASATHYQQVLVSVAGSDGTFAVYRCEAGSIVRLGSFFLEVEEPSQCDQLVLLSRHDHILLVCGLRDGRLLTAPLTFLPNFVVGTTSTIRFGNSTVKLTRSAAESDRAYAMCGTDTCLLRLDTTRSSGLTIENIWVADKERPALAQSQIFGCTRLPHSDVLTHDGSLSALGSSLVMMSATELWVTVLGLDTTVVPRQINVKGTPFRVIYAHAQRSLVSASLVTEITEHNKRRTYPHLEFIDSRKGCATTGFDLDAGEEVFSLLEWSLESDEKSKLYLFVLAGGKYIRGGSRREVRGRVRFLKLSTAKDSVKSQFAISLEKPVYAMALYDKITFVVCYGRSIRLYRFADGRVHPICPPLDLASSAASVSCQDGEIFVATRNDSLIAIRAQKQVVDGETITSEPYRLTVRYSSPRPDAGVSHATLAASELPPVDARPASDLALMATINKQVVGLSMPIAKGHSMAASINFEAILPQSVTKIRRCNIKPAWRATPQRDIVSSGFIGCCTNGSIIGMSVITESLWRRLFWLQRLCEWDPIMSPHTHDRPAYSIANDDLRGSDRASPIGLSTASSDVMLSQPHGYEEAARAKHIDGDVLTRLLNHGDNTALRSIIQRASERTDHIGEWLRKHLEAELAAVDPCIAELELVLSSWL